MKYKENILQDGQVAGFGYRLNQAKLKSQGGNKSPLQSWFHQLKHFPTISSVSQCQVWIDKPTFVTNLEARVIMYHHLCDSGSQMFYTILEKDFFVETILVNQANNTQSTE